MRSGRRLRAEAVGLLRDDLLHARGGWILGLKGGFSSVGDTARESVGRIGSLARAAFHRDDEPGEPLTGAGPKERFQSAMDVYDRDDAYVEALQDNKYRTVLLYLAMAVGIFAIDLATWRSYVSNAFLVVGHISPIVPALALAFQASFINWQMRHRRLDGILSFAKRPSEWWPEQSPAAAAAGRLRAARPAALVLMAAAAASASILGTAPSAMADDGATSSAATGSAVAVSLFQPLPTTDLWGKLLGMVFPNVITALPGASSAISDGITDGFSAFISVLMAFGAVSLAWFTILGAVSTAHEGKVLGQRYHLIWAPIRVVYGFASLAPVVKGYCLLQVLCLWFAIASGAMGNVIWNGFVTGLTAEKLPTPDLPETMNFVKEQLGTEVCFATAAEVAKSYGTPVPTWPSTGVKEHTVRQVASNLWHDVTTAITGNGAYRDPDTVYNYGWDYGACGGVSVDLTTDGSSPLAVLGNAQLKAVDALRTSLKPIADKIVASQEADSGASGTAATALSDIAFSEVTAAKAAYDKALSDANNSFVTNSTNNQSSLSDFKMSATSGGWVMAGPYYMTIARLNTAFMNATRFMPTVGHDTFNPGVTVTGDGESPLSDRLFGTRDSKGTWSTFTSWWQAGLQEDSSITASAASAGTMTSDSAWSIAKDAASPDSGLQSGAMWFVKLDPTSFDGMQQMVDLGDHLIDIAEALGLGGTIFSMTPAGKEMQFANKVKSAITGTSGASLSGPLTGVSFFLLLVAGAVLASAVFDSLVLPMMPFVHFFFAVLGCLVVVAEAVVAAPLWALAHIRMDGQEFHDGPQKQGYAILSNLLFRIPLTLFGLFFSFLIFDAMIWLLSVTIYPAMESATADSLFGVVGTVAMIVLISTVNWQVATRSFGLIHQMPDRVLRWIGGGTGDEGNEAHTSVNAFAGSMRGMAQSTAQQALGGSRGRSPAPGPTAAAGAGPGGGSAAPVPERSEVWAERGSAGQAGGVGSERSDIGIRDAAATTAGDSGWPGVSVP